jgi:hypothetical protein
MPCASAQAFDGHHRATFDLSRRYEAGADRGAIEEHRAGAAIAGIAADLRAPEFELLPEHQRKSIRETDLRADALTIELEAEGLCSGGRKVLHGSGLRRQL